MICNECMYGIYAQAFSDGKCENCETEVTTPHMPCDKLCEKCSDELKKCKSCGEPINE